MPKNPKTRLVCPPPSSTSSEEDDEITEQEEQGMDVDQKANRLSNEAQSEQDSEGEEQETPPLHASPVPDRIIKDESDSERANDTTPLPHVTLKPAPLSAKASGSKKKVDSGREDCPTPKSQEKKAVPNRLWKIEDQISLLQGVAEYKAINGVDPKVNSFDLYDFVNGRLDSSFSKAQVSEKIRRLRNKFFTLYEKGDVPISCPDDLKVYELCANIWGSKIRSSGKSLDATGGKAALNVCSSNGKAVEASNAMVKKRIGSKKADEASNAVASPNDMAETKKRKKRTSHKDEEVEEKRHKTAVGEQDGQMGADLKGKKNAFKGNQKAAKLNGDHTSGGQDNQTACEVNCIGVAMNDVVGAGKENRTDDFQSKHPRLIKSISKMNYPLGNEELFDRFKEKATLLDCSVAMELEEGWAEVWEEYGKISEKLAKLVSKQTTLLNDA